MRVLLIYGEVSSLIIYFHIISPFLSLFHLFRSSTCPMDCFFSCKPFCKLQPHTFRWKSAPNTVSRQYELRETRWIRFVLRELPRAMTLYRTTGQSMWRVTALTPTIYSKSCELILDSHELSVQLYVIIMELAMSQLLVLLYMVRVHAQKSGVVFSIPAIILINYSFIYGTRASLKISV